MLDVLAETLLDPAILYPSLASISINKYEYIEGKREKGKEEMMDMCQCTRTDGRRG